jgi:HlyD family secretion protein
MSDSGSPEPPSPSPPAAGIPPAPPRRASGPATPLLLAALLLAGGTAGAWWWHGQRQTARRAEEARIQTPLPRRIAALGRVEPLDGVVKLSVPASLANDPVARILVEEGAQVQKGQPLAVLESADSLQRSVEQAQAAIAVAQRKLVAQDAVIEKNRAQLQQAEVELRRYDQLFRDGAASAETLDRRRTLVSTSQANLDEARAERQTLGAEVEQRRADLARNSSELAKASIRAPFSGTVFKIYARPGDKVGDDGILDIGDSSRMGVIAEVYQTDRPGIALGQKATVSADGFQGKQLQGEVVEIARQVSRQTVFSGQAGENLDRRVIEVKIGLGPQANAIASYINYLQVNVMFEPLSPEQKRQQQERQQQVLQRQMRQTTPPQP